MKIQSLLISTFLLGACASAPIKAMTGAYASCSKADLGEIVTNDGKTLLDDVAAQIKTNSSALEADFKTLLGKVGLDAIMCAVVAVEAAINAGNDTSKPSTNQPLPGLIRAKAFIAEQSKG